MMLQLQDKTFPNGYFVIQAYEFDHINLAIILAYNETAVEPYVTAKVSEGSLRSNEWYSGHYFTQAKDAVNSYNARVLETVSDEQLFSTPWIPANV